MASVIKIKRSSVAGKVPSTSHVDTGELALNIADGRLYSSNGSSVFELGANPDSLSVGSGGFSIANGAITFPTSAGANGQVLSINGSGTLSFTSIQSGIGRETVNRTAANTSIGTSDHGSVLICTNTDDIVIDVDDSSTLTTGDKFTIIPTVLNTNIVVNLGDGDVFLNALTASDQISEFANVLISTYQDDPIGVLSDLNTYRITASLLQKIEILYIGSGEFVITTSTQT